MATNPRREIAPYRPPVGNAAPAKPTPEPERTPKATDKAHGKPATKPTDPDGETISTRLNRSLVAKLDRLRRKLGGTVALTRSAALRWLLEQHPE